MNVPVSKHGMLALVPRITEKAPKEERQRCHLDGVDLAMRWFLCKSHSQTVLSWAADDLRKSELTVLLSDKEGGFALLPNEVFREKALQELTKNLNKTSLKPAKLKRAALNLLEEMDLEALHRQVTYLGLTMFFSANMH